MNTKWDYTELAPHYLNRPDYAVEAIDHFCDLAEIRPGAKICDVGAGSAHLTKLLVAKGYSVSAVEPNDAMREVGMSVTADKPVDWSEGTGEKTGQPDTSFDAVTFGSSFNTTDRPKALLETKRILKPGGWFACLWNHRDLAHPLQVEVENLIKSRIEGYGYGSRREDQTEAIRESRLFDEPQYIEASYVAEVPAEVYIDAWRSHGTLQRQAGESFYEIIDLISSICSTHGDTLQVGYTTRLWAAKLLSD